MQEVKQIHASTCKEVSIGINFFSNSSLILANDIDVLSKAFSSSSENKVFRRSFHCKLQLIESSLRYDVLFLRMLGYQAVYLLTDHIISLAECLITHHPAIPWIIWPVDMRSAVAGQRDLRMKRRTKNEPRLAVP